MDNREPLVLNFNSLPIDHQDLFQSAISEVIGVLGSVTGTEILDWYHEHGTTGMTGISRAVNQLILDGLKNSGWDLPWRYFELASQQATFEAGKTFQANGCSLRVGLDFGTRHKQSSLAYLVRPVLLSHHNSESAVCLSAGILIAFTRETLDWGLWNPANSTYESLTSELELAAPLLTSAMAIIGVNPAPNLSVSKNLDYGGLDLELT